MNAQTIVEAGGCGSHSKQLIPTAKRPAIPKHQFRKVTDSRGHPIRGLWQRNQRFYAQLRVPGKPSAVKVPLVDSNGAPLRTVAQSRAALHDLQKQRRENCLPVLKKTPTLGKWAASYLDWLREAEIKNLLTIAKEASALANWTALLGPVRLANIRRAHVNDFIAWRKATHKVSNRTINLDLIALNNCLRHAVDEGLLVRLPTENWRPLEHRAPRRPLWTAEQIESVCQAALQQSEAGQSLVDLLDFLSFSGARRNEALNLLWSDVDWDGRRVALRKTKFGRPRQVDFSPALENLLKTLDERKNSATDWIIAPQRGSEPIETIARRFQSRLEDARAAAGLPDLCFHDLRHYFISTCVMAGIDYLTIAQWVGHRDGGILIGKVYGHLNDDHTKKMAERLGAYQLGKQEAA